MIFRIIIIIFIFIKLKRFILFSFSEVIRIEGVGIKGLKNEPLSLMSLVFTRKFISCGNYKKINFPKLEN